MPLVFLLFVIVPITEIALFIEVGDVIGLWPTLGIVIATAFLGTGLLRAQGLAAFARAQATMADGRVPVEEVVHGFCLVIAGALLLTPGFLTDAVGFALFLPPVRLALGRAALRWFSKHGTMHVHTSSGVPDPRYRAPDIVEGEAEEIDQPVTPAPDAGKSDPSSPWRQTPPNTKD
jgi:UPF0716 protein FxsA